MRNHLAVLLLTVAAIAGCSKSGPVPIKPVFFVDGEPLTKASISFVRDGGEKGRAAFGMTDDSGTATLTTYKPSDGVLPGSYRVVVIKAPENAMTFESNDSMEDADVAAMSSMRDFRSKGVPARRRVRSVLSDVYTDPGTTPLTCKVDYGIENPKFELEAAE